jgi:Transcription factor DP
MAMNIIIKDKKAIMWRGLPTSLASASMILPDGSIPMPPPLSVESYQTVQNDIEVRTKNIQKKREMMQEFLLQHVCFRNLVERNYQREQQLQKEVEIDATQSQGSKSPSADSAEQNAKGTPTTQESSKSKQQLQRDPQEEISQKKKKQQKLLLDNKIPLPFIVINTNKNAVIQCNMSRDLTDVMFDFTMPFEINDDNSILKRLQLYVIYIYTALNCGRPPISHFVAPFLTYGRFSSISTYYYKPIHRRHRTNHQILRKMLPDHIYQYCVTNHLLDNMILTRDDVNDNDVNLTFQNIATTSATAKTAVTMKGQ